MSNKKTYHPETLIYDGRFQALYVTLAPGIQADVIQQIGFYLKDCSYADDANYGHLKNLFPCMAIYNALQKNGMPKKESLAAVRDAMYKAVQPNRKKMQKLSKLPGILPIMKWIFPKMEKKSNGKGWDVSYPPTDKNTFAFHTHRCIYKTIFDDYGVPELGPVFCYVDDIIYGELPGIQFERKGTLCSGESKCDFCFRKRDF